ncbi:hypothetical protein C3489_17140 [Streptomyces sp. Ru71]|uniref:hypothetical protein n=1 Tax=Streptomyces sp. Ru71 TaxID=2080746 RepID=UPI000CDD8F6C|nr:hypothetical protein [Streptomyces sp. Ru71]POX52705.1 hypothetical protein C3489_17140 [Streptomyces sp. Ru71]
MGRTAWGIGGASALLVLAAGWWYAEGDAAHPFGDRRACAHSDVPLDQALGATGLSLPAGAEDVHYVSHAAAASGEVRLAVSLRSSRHALRAYLRDSHLVPDVDDLDDYNHGDAGNDPATLGLCGGARAILAPAAQVDQRRAAADGSAQTVSVAFQLSPAGTIRATADVQITVRAGG